MRVLGGPCRRPKWVQIAVEGVMVSPFSALMLRRRYFIIIAASDYLIPSLRVHLGRAKQAIINNTTHFVSDSR